MVKLYKKLEGEEKYNQLKKKPENKGSEKRLNAIKEELKDRKITLLQFIDALQIKNEFSIQEIDGNVIKKAQKKKFNIDFNLNNVEGQIKKKNNGAFIKEEE